LVGAAGAVELSAVPAPERLVRRYGTEAARVCAVGGPELNCPISPATEVTRAELVFGVRHEGALDVSDLLDRRTRIGLDPAARATAERAAEDALADR
jgi:glycerol-3-phosphate dehydrogenase